MQAFMGSDTHALLRSITQQSLDLFSQQELDNFYTYPISVLSQKLYLGNWAQANDAKIQRDLKLTGFINCCLQEKGE